MWGGWGVLTLAASESVADTEFGRWVVGERLGLIIES